MNAADHQADAAPLWAVLRARLIDLCVLFGLPGAIAQRLMLPRAEYKRLSRALSALEQLLRRVLLLEALKLSPEPPPEAKRGAPRRGASGAGGALFDPDRPESWRARFNLGVGPPAPPPAKGVRAARRVAGEAAPTRGSAPLALRLEALIRAFANPAPLARKLAQRLAAHALTRKTRQRPRNPIIAFADTLCAALVRNRAIDSS